MSVTVMTDAELYARLRGVLNAGWHAMPDYPGYRGTGAPGLLLEELLGLDGSNRDTPDAGKWEIKFHGPKTALMTLFHLEGEPKGHMHHMVREFGWEHAKGPHQLPTHHQARKLPIGLLRRQRKQPHHRAAS